METAKVILGAIAIACAGCGDDGVTSSTSGQNQCATGNDLYTYAVPLTPYRPSVVDIAMDDTNIYVTDTGSWQTTGNEMDGKIFKIPIVGDDAIPLATGEILPHYIVVDEQNIYWTTATAVRKMSLSGGTPSDIWSNGGSPQDLVINGGFLYFTLSPAKLVRLSLDTNEVTELVDGSATSAAFSGIAMDSTHIYWTSRGQIGANDASVMKMPREGGAVTTLATAQSQPTRIAVDATNVYWGNSGNFDENVGLMKIPIEGGTPTTLVSTKASIYSHYAAIAGVFVDERFVYWTSKGSQKYDHYDGALMRMPVDGTEPLTIVSVPSGQDRIIVRDCQVYFTAGGRIDRIGNPL